MYVNAPVLDELADRLKLASPYVFDTSVKPILGSALFTVKVSVAVAAVKLLSSAWVTVIDVEPAPTIVTVFPFTVATFWSVTV